MIWNWLIPEATIGDITERLRAKADLLDLMAELSPNGICRVVAEDMRAGATEIERLRERLRRFGPPRP